MFFIYAFLLASFLAVYGFTYLGAISYAADLLSNFPHYFIISGFIMGVLGLAHFKKTAILFLAVALFETLKLTSFFIPLETPNGETVKVVQYNQYYYNRTPEEVFEWLKSGADGADIVAIDEAEDETLNRLHLVTSIFPHQHIEVSGIGRRNVAILTRLPVLKEHVYDFKNQEKMWHFYIKLDLRTFEGKEFSFYATHLSSPHAPFMWENRNKQLTKLAEDVKADSSENKIVVGDMNVTPNSYWFKNFMAGSGLKNSMEGTNVRGTWPAFIPGFLRIAIDHIFYTGNIVPVHRKTMPPRGSDHLPLMVEFKVF